MLLKNKIAISMDGKAAWRDNVFVERLWRSVKYEEVYLHAYASVAEACAGLGRHLGFYNALRPHSSLGARTPDQAYLTQAPLCSRLKISPPVSGSRSSRATPSLRDAQTPEYYPTTRQSFH